MHMNSVCTVYFGREIYLRGGTKAQNQAFFGC